MPGRGKCSAPPHVIQIRGPDEISDTERFSEDAPPGRLPESGGKSLEPERDDGRPKMAEGPRDRGSEKAGRKREVEGFECKRCPFWCEELKAFKEHVDARHPDVILDPLYRCAVCDFDSQKFELFTEHNKKLHPDHNKFKLKRLKENHRTVLEQSLPSPCGDGGASLPFSPALFQPKDAIAAININGTVIIPPPPSSSCVPPETSSHVSPVLRRPPNFSQQARIAVPLNGAKYHPSLDRNATLMASFNKFPYPTQAELSWLTAASKHPEEQIKVWFATQRLKQGITWSPEEVEEARKKMFDGSIPPAPRSFSAAAGPDFAALAGSPLPAKRCAAAAAPGGPESKRPLVVSGAGDPSRDVPPFAAEAKKSPAVVPLMPAGKIVSLVGNPKSKAAAASLPPIVFPESLTRPTIAPPPIFAPAFPSSVLVPPPLQREAAFSDPSMLLGARRPPVIRAAPAPGKLPALRMARDHAGDSVAVADFPLLERMKGKTAEQLKILEEHFSRNSFLSRGDADNLALATRISRQEIDGWFAERRALRDNMEVALLNSMGTKRSPAADKETATGHLRLGAELPKRSYPPPPRALSNSLLHAPFLKDPQSGGPPPPSEVWPGLARVDLARWFCDARSLPDGQFLRVGGGVPGLLEKNPLSDPCQEGGAKFQEAGPDGRANGVGLTQCGEMQDHFTLPGAKNNADLPITTTRFVASASR
ncbi:zinc fingers and homeoboxes protein 2-like [Stigmatopora nigra]